MGTVKDNIAVGVVMYQKNVVLTAEIDDFGVELRRADAAHGVGGQADQHELALRATSSGMEVTSGRKWFSFVSL